MSEPAKKDLYKVTRVWYVEAASPKAAVVAAAPKREKILRVTSVWPEEANLLDTIEDANQEYLMQGPGVVLVQRHRGRRVGD